MFLYETCQLMPVRYHLAKKTTLRIGRAIESLFPSQSVQQQKIQKQYDFSGIEYVFQGIKCTCKEAYPKKGNYLTSKKFILEFCLPDSIMQLFFGDKINFFDASKLIFRAPKRFQVHDKVIIFFSHIFASVVQLSAVCNQA